jgi:small subunit ribosomal protein S18
LRKHIEKNFMDSFDINIKTKEKNSEVTPVIAIVQKKPRSKYPLRKETIDYKNIALLTKFISPQGKILSKRTNGLNAKQQRNVAKAVKNARILGFLPFINKTKSENF